MVLNYNRDVETFPVVKTIITRITGNPDLYRSPTDMGVNMVGNCITDDEAVKEACKQEIIRRYYKACCDYKNGNADIDVTHRIEALMQQLDITAADRLVAGAANKREKDVGVSVTAIELPDGRIITGKQSELMTAPAAAILNSIKTLSGMADEIYLLSPIVLEPMQRMKRDILKNHTQRLNLEEVLMALSICAATNSMVELAITKLCELSGCEAHSTTILSPSDESMLRKLKLNFTCEPEFSNNSLYNV